MKRTGLRTVAYTLLAVILWASVASSGNAEPVGAEHGWVESDAGIAASESRATWGGCAAPAGSGGADAISSCPLDWQVRALTIGGVGQAAEHLRRRLPVLQAIVAERGTNLTHWLALLPWNGM
jgi:hypothetical protein